MFNLLIYLTNTITAGRMSRDAQHMRLVSVVVQFALIMNIFIHMYPYYYTITGLDGRYNIMIML